MDDLNLDLRRRCSDNDLWGVKILIPCPGIEPRYFHCFKISHPEMLFFESLLQNPRE